MVYKSLNQGIRQGNSLVFLQNQELCENEILFSARSKAVVALRASLPEWRGERSICEITKNGMESLITELGLAPYVPLTVWEKINGAAGEKKNRVRCKNAGLQPHSHSTNPFLRSKKGKWRRRQKKIKGYGTSASAASENFKVPSFQSSGRSGGPRARAPKSAQKSPLFFFFFFFFSPKKSKIMRCRIIRYMELFPWY